MSRYSASASDILGNIRPEDAGVALVVVAPGEESAVVEALTVDGNALPHITLSTETLERGPARAIVTLPTNGLPEIEYLLIELNNRRTWLGDRNRLILLVIGRQDLVKFQHLAPDLFSALLFVRSVSFVPNENIELEAARHRLWSHYSSKFGILDLRGFIRSESEDVSWHVEEIYQDLRVRGVSWSDAAEGARLTPHSPAIPLLELLEGKYGDSLFPERGHDRPIVLLGHPGSGKTFFLRFLALHASKADVALGIEQAIPLITSLSTYLQAPGPVNLVEHLLDTLLLERQAIAHLVPRSIEEGKVVFLLDGLDEVGDEQARRRIVAAVLELVSLAPKCVIIVTSRIAGYSEAPLGSRVRHLLLAPFDLRGIRAFLMRWSELYACALRGDSPRARTEGRLEGEQLARDVLANRQVRALAGNPLLLTVLAIVHRAGVRLPDHRIELYEHATRVLVERWNRVRSLSGVHSQPPMKSADAVRLLGPVALQVSRSGARGAIPESLLRSTLSRVLREGKLKGLASADEALDLFKRSLGLLVEQSPGTYAFLHLTLAEYFAAWELVRSGQLEELANDPVNAFRSESRELILLAAGELGVIRADDERLKTLIGALCDSARRRPGKPSPGVPSLLAGLVADDPGLSEAEAKNLIKTLIPTWWFKRQYGFEESLGIALVEATSIVEDRLMQGRFAHLVKQRVADFYGKDVPDNVKRNLSRGGQVQFGQLLNFIDSAKVDYGPAFLSLIADLRLAPNSTFRGFVLDAENAEMLADAIVVSFLISKTVHDAVLRNEVRLGLVCTLRFSDGLRRRSRRVQRNVAECRYELANEQVRLFVSVEYPDFPEKTLETVSGAFAVLA